MEKYLYLIREKVRENQGFDTYWRLVTLVTQLILYPCPTTMIVISNLYIKLRLINCCILTLHNENTN